MQKKICAIVPAKGSAENIDKCIESILNTGYPYLDIIVVDDGLTDCAIERLTRLRNRIRILKSNSGGPSYARNLAAGETDAEFLAFTDSDCIVEKNWIDELLRGFREFPETAACGGSQRIPADASLYEKSVFLFMKKTGFLTDYVREGKDEIREVFHNASCSVLYKRDVFLESGGFLRDVWPGEDVELDYRLKRKGYKLVFNPKAIVYHYRPKHLNSFCRMMHRYGFAQGFLVRKYGVFRRIQVLPFLSLAVSLLFLIALLFQFYLPALVLAAIVLFCSWIYFNKVFFIAAFGILNWHLGFFKKFFGI